MRENITHLTFRPCTTSADSTGFIADRLVIVPARALSGIDSANPGKPYFHCGVIEPGPNFIQISFCASMVYHSGTVVARYG